VLGSLPNAFLTSSRLTTHLPNVIFVTAGSISILKKSTAPTINSPAKKSHEQVGDVSLPATKTKNDAYNLAFLVGSLKK
jgi:hypothetical protein